MLTKVLEPANTDGLEVGDVRIGNLCTQSEMLLILNLK